MWMSHMEIDGPTFGPKGGYFLLIWVKVSLKQLAFSSFFSQFYELAFQTKCWLFQTRNPLLFLFLAFLAVGLSQFSQILFEWSLKGHLILSFSITIFDAKLY